MHGALQASQLVTEQEFTLPSGSQIDAPEMVAENLAGIELGAGETYMTKEIEQQFVDGK